MSETRDSTSRQDVTVFPGGGDSMPSLRSASELLNQLNVNAAEPIDGLLQRLCSGLGADELLGVCIQSHPENEAVWQRALQGLATAEDLEVAKQQAKLGFRPGSQSIDRDASMLGYVYVIAVGVVEQGVLASSVSRELLEEWFVAIAGACSGSTLSGLFARAGERLACPLKTSPRFMRGSSDHGRTQERQADYGKDSTRPGTDHQQAPND